LTEKKKLELKYSDYLWIYLDETYIHKNLTTNEIILCDNELPKLKLPIGKGLHFSIIHAGSVDGFIENAYLILVNEGLNSESFEKWLSEKLFSNLPKKSIIVLNNVTTHSRYYSQIPTQASNKQFIKDWLTKNKISYPENALKPQLLDIVKKNLPKNNYTVDQIIKDAGHIPIRLPPYHCHLNSIEMVWA